MQFATVYFVKPNQCLKILSTTLIDLVSQTIQLQIALTFNVICFESHQKTKTVSRHKVKRLRSSNDFFTKNVKKLFTFTDLSQKVIAS